MTVTATIVAKPRTEVGKSASWRLRRAGIIPGILYGGKAGNRPLAFPANQLERLIATGGRGQLVDVVVGDERFTALIKEVQRDTSKDFILHVDFHAVDLDTEIETVVPLVLAGEDERPNDGGFITQTLREVQIACLPRDLPEQLTVDVSNLQIGESVTVKDIAVPEGVRVLTDADTVVATVMAPRKVAEDEAGEGTGDGAAQESEESSPS